ncbi:SusC/RagA family TonB-linked outer membrane protein [Solitalea canadensis]|uniref:TonB-linked outer membrane protein, SusC/RagA family n=1 Tax=Solitalea canadensis (strain ATCC 29591 / DSM 3403 / JCM 21819 / LMG 8368 / NBRC 15130 / NCIMB 12057 / USAM 9D) TaxID=929556 RepID=H8KXB8_SOLCM|nr:SusC/RagA family TonB-linked outer membrane protein [Solitalea canadensis]AFD08447.1 TonB-linked outer membrane protein, SusC/RagA family [Solitalea canadensis DSM 3403]
MKKKSTLLLLMLIFLFYFSSLAQNREVSGKVTSAADGSALAGVTVLIKGSSKGTNTDGGGDFKVNVPAGNSVLVFSLVGFISKEINVGSQQTLTIVLETDQRVLNEVVVTALGTAQEKKSLGYSFQNMKSQELMESKQSNLLNAMQGKLAGVQISSMGGAPGQSSRIIIRGINSLDPNSNNQPLFVIDGIPIDNSTTEVGTIAGTRGLSNRATDINPEDIESVSILKGGAATVLYGSRGANGAVVITTKKGKSGGLRVDFSSTFGFDQVNKYPDVQRTFTQGFGGEYDPESFWPSWGPSIADAKKIDPSHPNNIYDNFRNAYETGNQFKNYISFGGGNDKTTFNFSASNLNQDGVLPVSSYKNTSIRLSGDQNFSEKFRLGAAVNYIKSGGDRVNADRFNEQLIYWTPRLDVTDYQKVDGTMKAYGETDNPVFGVHSNRYEDDVNRFLGNLHFTYSPFKWADVTYRVGMDYYTDFRKGYGPAPAGLPDEVPFSDNELGFYNEYNIQSRDLTSTLNLTFKKDFGQDFVTSFRVGNDIFQKKFDRLSTEGEELDIYNLFSMNNAKIITSSQTSTEERLVGLYGDLSVAYKNFLFLNITGRNDWTSTLPKGNNSFFYPSVSLGYVFSDQFKLPEFWNYGKFRISYGEVGKGTTAYRTNIYYEKDVDLPASAIGWTRSDEKGQNTLKPERTKTFETGAELRFLKDRLGVDFTWYKSNSIDQIIPVTVSDATGYSTIVANAGEIENKGFEIMLDAQPVKTNDFRWDIKLTYSRNKNKVISIIEGSDEITVGEQFGYLGSTATLKLIPGQAYGNIYGTSWTRYGDSGSPFAEKDKPLLIESGTGSATSDGFPVRNTDPNQKILGNTQPKWIGGLANTFTYKNFSLYVLLDTRQGFQKYNQFANFMAAFGTAKYTENRTQSQVFNGVIANGQPNTQMVYLGQGVGPDGKDYTNGYYRNIFRGVTEEFVEDASWVRLRTVTLNWNLPGKWFTNTPISGLSLSITGNNLWLHTDYTGFDPESSSTGAETNADGFSGFTYPGLRSYFLNLNVSF